MYKKIILGTLMSVIVFSFTGCFNQQMIKVNELDNGSKEYVMNNKINIPITRKKYRNWKIHDFVMNVSANNDIMKISVIHSIGFVQGTGTPLNNSSSLDSAKWIADSFYENFISIDINELDPIKRTKNKKWKSFLFDTWYDGIGNIYKKEELVQLIKNENIVLKIKSKRGEYSINLTGEDMKKLRKFVHCMEDEKFCKDNNE